MGGWVDGWMGGWTDGWMDGGMDERVDAWMDGWMDGCVDGWMDGWVDGWVDGWMEGWVDGWVDGWMDPLILPQASRYPRRGDRHSQPAHQVGPDTLDVASGTPSLPARSGVTPWTWRLALPAGGVTPSIEVRAVETYLYFESLY